MCSENLAIGLITMPLKVERQASNSVKRMQGSMTILLAMLFISVTALAAPPVDPSREQVIKVAAQIQRADYEGDRGALNRLYGELTPIAQSTKLASRVRYWRGFALWRRTMNGFNESVDPKGLEEDLKQAVSEFDEALRIDPGFVDAKVGAISCLSNLLFLNQKNAARVQELVAQAVPLRKEAEAAVTGESPPPLGAWSYLLVRSPGTGMQPGQGDGDGEEGFGGGSETERSKQRSAGTFVGEPELLAALAWGNLHRTTPDLNAAEEYARSALTLVPYWHYVRDVLIPQIQEAKKKPH